MSHISDNKVFSQMNRTDDNYLRIVLNEISHSVNVERIIPSFVKKILNL